MIFFRKAWKDTDAAYKGSGAGLKAGRAAPIVLGSSLTKKRTHALARRSAVARLSRLK